MSYFASYPHRRPGKPAAEWEVILARALKQEKATQAVLEQAEVLSEQRAMAYSALVSFLASDVRLSPIACHSDSRN
jgi:hypothetical protein